MGTIRSRRCVQDVVLHSKASIAGRLQDEEGLPLRGQQDRSKRAATERS